jgi:hypothetical protein
MCTLPTCVKEKPMPKQKKYRLADFFDRWWDIYKRSPKEPITPEQYKAVNALRVCRTEALGVDCYACPDCGETTKIYHSCKNRFCPTCSWQDTLKWADRIKGRMMDIPHRHVVMTLPHQLNPLVKKNRDKLLSLLLRVSADTFKDWMGHRYKVKPGIISVLHTFGETKDYHVHVHMILSWGGLDKETSALMPIESEYVNYGFLKAKFRCKFEDGLIALFDKGSLYHGFKSRDKLLQFIKQLNQEKWIIHLEPPMEIPTQVVRYIGRYSKRACLSEYKITEIDGEDISFRYKDYKTKDSNNKPVERILKLNYRDFFPRLLQHVPLKYFRVVRYYGMYSNRASIPKEFLYTENNEPQEATHDNWELLSLKKTGINPYVCSSCNKRKVYVHTQLKSRYKNKTIRFKRTNLIDNNFREGKAA